MKKVILVIACLAIIVFGGMHFLMPEKTTPHLTQFFSKEHKEVQRIQDWLKYKQQQQLLLVDVVSPVSPNNKVLMLNISNKKLSSTSKIFSACSSAAIKAKRLKSYNSSKFMR
jgi:hypothetical protein